MDKLNAIQKRGNLNSVYKVDEIGPGGAYHKYAVKTNDNFGTVADIRFQKGPRRGVDSTHGVLDSDLLEIVRHRLQCFQAGAFATRENAVALTHIEEALMWMNRRVDDRIERNVLGTMEK